MTIEIGTLTANSTLSEWVKEFYWRFAIPETWLLEWPSQNEQHRGSG
jgi:hypothetical protein